MTCLCGHPEDEHRRSGACIAIVHTRVWLSQLCPCNHFIAISTVKRAEKAAE